MGGNATVNARMRSLVSAVTQLLLWTRVRMRSTTISRKSPIRSKRMFLKKRKPKKRVILLIHDITLNYNKNVSFCFLKKNYSKTYIGFNQLLNIVTFIILKSFFFKYVCNRCVIVQFTFYNKIMSMYRYSWVFTHELKPHKYFAKSIRFSFTI